MDHAADVIDERPTIQAEQAIFTSIRSPMGQGYRIVAASGGLTPEEKSELTRRSPSHASLCDDSERATALASYKLGSGRVVVAVSMHAGLEHTARGGQRVCTHIVVLEAQAFERFACDPLRVRCEALRRLGSRPALEDSSRLLTLELNPEGGLERSVPAPTGEDAERILQIMSGLLRGQRLALRDVPRPIEFMEAVFQALPFAIRRSLSLSVGLKYSPARDHDVLVLSGPLGDRQRPQGDDQRVFISWSEKPALQAGPHDAWLAFVRRMWSAGRETELAQLARRLTEAGPGALRQIVALCDDLERVDQGDLEATRQLLARHVAEKTTMAVHAELLAKLRAKAQQRLAMLQELEEQKEAAAEGVQKGVTR
jgi:hypothetical protein